MKKGQQFFEFKINNCCPFGIGTALVELKINFRNGNLFYNFIKVRFVY